MQTTKRQTKTKQQHGVCATSWAMGGDSSHTQPVLLEQFHPGVLFRAKLNIQISLLCFCRGLKGTAARDMEPQTERGLQLQSSVKFILSEIFTGKKAEHPNSQEKQSKCNLFYLTCRAMSIPGPQHSTIKPLEAAPFSN